MKTEHSPLSFIEKKQNFQYREYRNRLNIINEIS